jgi:hypothetical protein
MRLSDAIALGRTMLSPCSGGSRHKVGADRNQGCALEMALVAAGHDGIPWFDAQQVWPWLTASISAGITGRFDVNVMASASFLEWKKEERLTLDQLIDYVRSIEPPEPEFVAELGAESALPMSESGSQREVSVRSTTALDVAQDPDRHGYSEEVA